MSPVPNTRSIVRTQRRSSRRWRAVIAAMTATMLAFFGVQSVATAAVTEGPVTLTVDYGDDTYNGEIVVTPGTTYSAILSYRIPELEDGHSVVIGVPEGVQITGSLDIPAGNTVVESL